MKDRDYIYAVAYIRTKEKGLLKDADIQTIASLKDEAAVISYLTERGWGTHDTKDAETLLSLEEEKTRKVMDELSVPEKVIEILAFPNIFHNLKTAVKQVCTGHEDPKAYFAEAKYNENFFKKILKENTYDQLPKIMGEAAQRAKDVMLKTRDGQLCDTIIDRAALESMIQEAKELGDSFLTKYAETICSTADIKMAVRTCDTGRPSSFLETALCPCASIDVKELAKAAAGGREEIYAFLGKTSFAEAADALQESFSSFERWCDNRIMDTIMGQKNNIMSSGPVVAYYLARQNEIRMIRIIITAKANGFPDQAISERLRKMYG